MNAKGDAQIKKLRQRLQELDAERTAVSAELHRLTQPESAQATAPLPHKDPIPGSAEKDWHVFAGPAKPKLRKRP